jgi:hypothetical protein
LLFLLLFLILLTNQIPPHSRRENLYFKLEHAYMFVPTAASIRVDSLWKSPARQIGHNQNRAERLNYRRGGQRAHDRNDAEGFVV